MRTSTPLRSIVKNVAEISSKVVKRFLESATVYGKYHRDSAGLHWFLENECRKRTRHTMDRVSLVPSERIYRSDIAPIRMNY